MSKPRIITYYLPAKEGTSRSYYRTIESFAEEAIQHVFETAGQLVEEFREFSNEGRRAGEKRACLDLLTLGVYLKERILPNWDRELLSGKDLLNSMALLKNWFEKIEYDPLISVVDSWKDFFETLSEESTESDFPGILQTVVNDFQKSAAEVLDKFTPNVEQFLERGNHEGRDDTEMRKYSRLEYHLNMVAAEILGKEFRESFLKTKRKIVLVPGCSRAQPDDKCKAISTPLGSLCQECTSTCRVRALTKLGERKGFETYIVGELSDVPKRLKKEGTKLRDVGVLGIACVATLAPGGREAEALGLPAQGVLLDYCGCIYHWNDNPDQLIITNFNIQKLLEVLGFR